MARSKYTERHCPYCNKQTKMEIVGPMEGIAEKSWYKCTRCRHLALLDTQNGARHRGPVDAKSAVQYDPQLKYSVGQAIFHSEWNDLGTVQSKIVMSNGNHAMIVSFEKLGERRLVENLKIDLPAETSATASNPRLDSGAILKGGERIGRDNNTGK